MNETARRIWEDTGLYAGYFAAVHEREGRVADPGAAASAALATLRMPITADEAALFTRAFRGGYGLVRDVRAMLDAAQF